MNETCVPYVRTSVDMQTYGRALALAWHEALGTWPTKGQAGVLYAQYGVETGGPPKAACWCWNLGNVKHVAGDGYDYYMLPNTSERINGKLEYFQPPSPITWFRAYGSLDVAMRDHFAFLRGKYKRCWQGVELEDVGLFARLLKEGPDGKENTADDYYTATSEAYAAGMRRHLNAWMASDAFELAMASVDAMNERPTEPIVEAAEPANDTTPLVEPGTILHITPLPEIPEREPPDDAA